MSRLQQQVVSEARRWIGTPYVHQASCRGCGCDCLGLIRGIWRAVLGGEPALVPAYTADWSEAARAEVLWDAARQHLVECPIRAARPGDVLLFRMQGGAVAKHLGILTGTDASPTFIHAYASHGVVENSLSAPWARRIVASFAFPERTN
ncbi:putative phage cell wall peptidase, NlpC/P60 family [Aliiroseovarius sediminilitoris]|uniref:Putative phage cell wall peptidase, NlpC/P60 family n=1 Tax=Aliiroseovarius sediminilitoris TaxID=1173584 RepID=A0A1I0Q1E5_9RHOB|nr:NlpC/P60 family protein [Aliiroseovarius sediminilitoris]SEW20590.1 putative phage cell wall peptidase, NlpC/P60 family [Aliiroseovarius sediminilitoris]